MSKNVQVIGAGGHAKVVISTLKALGKKIVSVYDDHHKTLGSDFMGIPVGGAFADAAHDCETYLAIGNNGVRKEIAESAPFLWGKALVHPRAWVDPSAKLGLGSVIFAGAIVQADSFIGTHVIVNTGATVDHDCNVLDYVHIAPGCHLCGGVDVYEEAMLGVGTKVIPLMKIGAKAVIGAGSVVIRDVQAGEKTVGVPAKAIAQDS